MARQIAFNKSQDLIIQKSAIVVTTESPAVTSAPTSTEYLVAGSVAFVLVAAVFCLNRAFLCWMMED